jgi:hypothetical protein
VVKPVFYAKAKDVHEEDAGFAYSVWPLAKNHDVADARFE